MTFKRDSVCKDNARIVLDVLRDEGPMGIRDITKAVSGYEIGDTQYSMYARTISSVLCKLVRKGNVINDRTEEGTRYRYGKEMECKTPQNIPSEGEHTVCDLVAVVRDGKVDRVLKNGIPVTLYIPKEHTGRGRSKVIEMPITLDRLRRGLKSGRITTGGQE